MTGEAGVICRRCGFANVAGDQFCGSCGAFLEWEGDVAADAAPPSAATAADDDLVGLVRPATSPPTPVPPPVAQSAAPGPVAPAALPVATGAPAASTAGLLRCPACGIANAPTRTFCQSCGARLAEASWVGEASREQISAAVSARPTPAPPALGEAARGDPSGRSTGRSSGGIAGWIIGVAVLGILVGVGIVAASVMLKSPGPASGATAAPSALASGGPGSSAAASAGTGGTDAPGTIAPATAEAGTPGPTGKLAGVPLTLTGVAASSVVDDLAKFQPEMAIDGNVKTSWQEGAANEKGQWIEVAFDPARVDAVVLNNGYGASTALYKGNLRLKKIQISINGGTPKVVTLKDTAKDQLIALGEHPGANRLRITIVSTYGAVKTSVSGTPFDDAALSEIRVLGVTGG